MNRKLFAYASALCVIGALGGGPQAAAETDLCLPSGICSFLSPSGRISCEITSHYFDMPDSAYCQWVNDDGTGYSAHLNPEGLVEACYQGSCLGNPGEGTPTLSDGRGAGIGPFQCRLANEAVTCTASPSDRGFVISAGGIAPVP